MTIKMHSKDLPEDGLRILGPTDPSFDERFFEEMKDEPSGTVEALRPFSFFLINESRESLVAYLVEWCFTKADGTNDCYRKAVAIPQALMEGENGRSDVNAKDSRVRPGSAVLLSLVSPQATSPFRLPVSKDEADSFRQGIRPDRNDIFQRYVRELAKYTDVTVSIDGAFFEDGTFVGEDRSGFFGQIKAQADAKRDLLHELALDSSTNLKSRNRPFDYLEAVANRPAPGLNYKSTPADYYDFYRNFYAKEILSSRNFLGDEKALATALRASKTAWRVLAKKPPRDR
jgi:hypothetical protein